MAINYFAYIDDFLISKKRSKKTRDTYKIQTEVFLRWLGDNLFTRKNVAKYFDMIEGETKLKLMKNGKKKEVPKYRPYSLKTKENAIKNFAKYLWEEDILPEKEYKKIKSYQGIKIDKGDVPTRSLTTEEIQKGKSLIIDPQLQMIFWTGLSYGLRAQEYRNLTVDDLDLDKKVLTVKQSKGTKTRQIAIFDHHIPFWERWLRLREAWGVDHDYVFFTARGKIGHGTFIMYTKKISEIIISKKYLDQAIEERITSHTLRRTYATNLMKGGVDIFFISKMLGHEKIETTQRYIRYTDEEILSKYREQAAAVI
ncbi:MAG: tyrosine-type recombinase/integrase [Candidatus Hodarchaeota archaeon]